MKSLTFKTNSSSKAALFIECLNNRLKAKDKSLSQYSIHLSPSGRTSTILYF